MAYTSTPRNHGSRTLTHNELLLIAEQKAALVFTALVCFFAGGTCALILDQLIYG